MASDSNRNSTLLVVVLLAAGVILAGSVWAMRQSEAERGASFKGPGVSVETRGGDVKIDAPYTSIQKDANGTRIQAPGVDIELPPKQGD
ncbi:MAG: hypothetical protein ABL897_13985 [Hyphomicrobium sp.]